MLTLIIATLIASFLSGCRPKQTASFALEDSAKNGDAASVALPPYRDEVLLAKIDESDEWGKWMRFCQRRADKSFLEPVREPRDGIALYCHASDQVPVAFGIVQAATTECREVSAMLNNNFPIASGSSEHRRFEHCVRACQDRMHDLCQPRLASAARALPGVADPKLASEIPATSAGAAADVLSQTTSAVGQAGKVAQPGSALARVSAAFDKVGHGLDMLGSVLVAIDRREFARNFEQYVTAHGNVSLCKDFLGAAPFDAATDPNPASWWRKFGSDCREMARSCQAPCKPPEIHRGLAVAEDLPVVGSLIGLVKESEYDQVRETVQSCTACLKEKAQLMSARLKALGGSCGVP